MNTKLDTYLTAGTEVQILQTLLRMRDESLLGTAAPCETYILFDLIGDFNLSLREHQDLPLVRFFCRQANFPEPFELPADAIYHVQSWWAPSSN